MKLAEVKPGQRFQIRQETDHQVFSTYDALMKTTQSDEDDDPLCVRLSDGDLRPVFAELDVIV